MSVDFILNKFKNNTEQNRYFIITNFNTSDSDLLIEALKSGNFKVYFNDNGVIEIKKGSVTTKKFNNNMTNASSIDIGVSNLVKMKDYKQKYIFSKPWGSYLLYIDNQKVTMRYNPIPRELANTVTSANRQSYNDYVIDVCMETDKLEPTCFCIHRDNDSHPDDKNSTEFCMDDLLGPELNKLAKRNAGSGGYIGPQCHCYNPRCNENNPYRVNSIVKLSPPGITPCPTSKNITICNTSFDARSIEAGDIAVEQKCGGSGDTNASIPSTPVSSPAVPAPTQPVTGSTYTSDKPPSTTPSTPSSTTPSKPPSKPPSTTPSKSNNTIYIIIAIVLLIILAAAYFLLK
jgi:hypothetical protein